MIQLFENKYFIIILAGALIAAASIFAKKYVVADTNKEIWLLLAMLSGILMVFAFVKLFMITDLGKGFVLVKYVSILLVLFMCVFYFNEKITMKDMIGAILGMIAIYLLCC